MTCEGVWLEEFYRGEASDAMDVRIMKCDGCSSRMVFLDNQFCWEGESQSQAHAVGEALRVKFSGGAGDFVLMA